jgi:hypothetical protein
MPREVAFSEIPDGAVLAADVFDGDGNVLLAKGTRLTRAHAQLIERRGVRPVMVVGEADALAGEAPAAVRAEAQSREQGGLRPDGRRPGPAGVGGGVDKQAPASHCPRLLRPGLTASDVPLGDPTHGRSLASQARGSRFADARGGTGDGGDLTAENGTHCPTVPP